ncbi:MAG: DUF3857 domain-containing protein, partial [Bacteroidetes bacterium]|nr:DUF3857 domain-containing protein [Bacteroidota bacterium]
MTHFHARIWLLPFCFIGFVQLHAQPGKKEITWNYLPDEHRDMVVYPYDTEAEAVILHDMGIWAPISIEKNQVVQQRHRRIKIFKESGVRLKDVVIEYKTGEKITGLKARTINYEDGKKVVNNLKLKYLPEEKAGNNRKKKSFTFRDVRPGSIIEYQYVIHTQDVEWLKPWYFQ